MADDLSRSMTKARKALQMTEDVLEELEAQVDKRRVDVKETIKRLCEPIIPQVDEDAFNSFLKEPYAIVPRKKDEWVVIVPRFVPFNVGWLEKSTPNFNYFVVNRYTSWLSDIPEILESKFHFKPHLPLEVVDGVLVTGNKYQSEAWERYKKHLTRRQGDDRIRIRPGAEFKLIADMVEDGILPFSMNPIPKKDLQDGCGKLELRSYQQKAWEKFLQTGAVGVFWPYSSGKTLFGSYVCDRIKGKKLVVVPSRTLIEQWGEYLGKYTDVNRWDVDVITYNSLGKHIGKYASEEYALVLYDECHTLPANTYIKGSTLRARYRMGFSGSPYREDGRESYIFALTGYPIGVDWHDLVDLGIIEYPDVFLYIVSKKREKLDTLLADPLKTVVFCDSIDTGKALSKAYGAPFVFSETKNRLETIEGNHLVFVSRVGDEGMSIKSIERVIEYDFLYGSRRQEGQRMGRVMHGSKAGQHIIIMTQDEFDHHNKRLNAIHERGIRIKVIKGK